MFPISWSIDKKSFMKDWPAEPKDLDHASALALAMTDSDTPITLSSVINLELTDYPTGTGSRTVEQAIRWALSKEGREVMKADEPANFMTRIEQLAEQLRYRR